MTTILRNTLLNAAGWTFNTSAVLTLLAFTGGA